MTTNEEGPTDDLTALQRLPEVDASPDDEGDDPTCVTTGVRVTGPDDDGPPAGDQPPDRPPAG